MESLIKLRVLPEDRREITVDLPREASRTSHAKCYLVRLVLALMMINR
jgi:hypothetical protein